MNVTSVDARPGAVAAEAISYEVSGRILLDRIDLQLGSGESVAITGPSGSGKTTLLMCLAGLLPITVGRILINGVDITRLRHGGRAALRLSQIGIIYQFGELLPELSPLENVALPLLLTGSRSKLAYLRAAELLGELGIAELADGRTATLSGGERQRTALARALITRPAVLLADEPTGSLDIATAEIVTDLLFGLPSRHNCALVVVTHNQTVAARADSQRALNAGKLSEAHV